MPTDWIALQLALSPHCASPARREASSVVGEQMRAQYFELVLASWSAHWGVAATPAGLSLGQKMPSVHLGEQADLFWNDR